jgi:quinol monooxygenase YgiN
MAGIVETNEHPFLIISGHISENKQKEFEHTFRIGLSGLTRDCIASHLSEDKNEDGQYYFFSLWSNERAMKRFMESPEFQMLSGAFHALGNITETLNGTVKDNHQSIHR